MISSIDIFHRPSNLVRPGGATVARLTPVQKVACSNHVRVKVEILNTLRDGGRSRIETIPQASERELCSSLKMKNKVVLLDCAIYVNSGNCLLE